jgi:hypothetical protein
MAARKIKRSNEFYRRALLGAVQRDGTQFPGLRDVAAGFSAADGYSLKNIDKWTPAQKAKITKYFKELDQLTAQPRYLFKSRNPEEMAKAKRVSGQDPKYKFKVAFLPYTPEKSKKTGEYIKPKITFTKDGIRIRQRKYSKIEIPLNKVRLAQDHEKEILRAIKANAPKASRFAVRAGVNEMPGTGDMPNIIRKVGELMNKYDGVTPLPKGSGNKGDGPQHHKWDQWLHSLIGYEIPDFTQDKFKDAVNAFDKARRELQLKRRAERKRIQRMKDKPTRKGKRK